MHEFSICQSILQQVTEIAGARPGERVSSILLRIGPLAGVEPSQLTAAFTLLAAGTACDCATIEIKPIPVQVECQLCGAVSAARANRLLCGACGTWRVVLISGDEMQIESIALAVPGQQENAHV
jgi:hydrogenase nickel incorporation protein HypA/HybF